MTSATFSARPLAGVRVFDMSRVLAAPYAAQTLGDFGAEVIKVERPGDGDQVRGFGSAMLKDREGQPTRESAMYLAVNRNKKGIAIDLSRPAGQVLARRLAAASDVFIENFVPGTAAGFGLDYAAIREVNPAIVYCSVSGFGQDGPYAARAGYDPLFQAMGGWMELTGHPDGAPGGGPMKLGPNVIDMIVGLNAAVGILVALRHRDATGRGQHIDLALLDTAIAAISPTAMQYLIGGSVPQRTGNHPLSGGPATTLQCRDGAIYFLATPQSQFENLCRILGTPDTSRDARYASYNSRWEHRDALAETLQAGAARWARQDLLDALEKAGIPAGAVNDLKAVFADPQVRHRGVDRGMAHPLSDEVRVIANPVRMSETPAGYDLPPPRLGEHTDEVLRNVLGMGGEEIAELRRDRVI